MKTRILDLTEEFDSLAIGASSGLMWSSPTIQLAGVGRLIVDASHIQSELDGCLNSLNAQLADSEFYAFSSFPFDKLQPGTVKVAEHTYVEDAYGAHIVTFSESSDNDVIEQVRQASTWASSSNLNDIELEESDSEVWKSKVAEAVRRIKETDLKKVVLSRKVTAKASRPLDKAQIAHNLKSGYPEALLFIHGEFIGASPEMLIAKSGVDASALPLAGTAKRFKDESRNAEQKRSLVDSTKDQWEHQITIDWFLDTLLPYCSFVDADPEPFVLELANVYHLATGVSGRLTSEETSILELVKALHPTPAVGGSPQQLALETIAELEAHDRENYAGPTGWFNSVGDGEFAVAIRSAHIAGNTAELYAGVGVVEDSNAELEYHETVSKLQAMLGGIADGS